MKALFIMLTTIALVFTAGCTKEQVKDKLCDTGKTAATILAAQASVELSCSNVEAIKASIENQLVSLKVCEAATEKPATDVNVLTAKSAIGEALCAPVIEGLFIGGVAQLPKEWGCTGGPLAEETKAKLIAACSKAF